MKKNGGEVTKFADYAKERIWRKNLDKFTLKIQLPNEEKREYRFGPNVVVHDVVKSICDELGITIAEIYGLQRVPGSTEWLNGRNRLELQIQEQEELLYIRQKYFPDVSLLTSKEKEFLLRQIEQDFRLGRNGQQTIPESFFAEFAAKVESSHKISIALAYLSKLPQFGQYVVRTVAPLSTTATATNSTTPAENIIEMSD